MHTALVFLNWSLAPWTRLRISQYPESHIIFTRGINKDMLKNNALQCKPYTKICLIFVRQLHLWKAPSYNLNTQT